MWFKKSVIILILSISILSLYGCDKYQLRDAYVSFYTSLASLFEDNYDGVYESLEEPVTFVDLSHWNGDVDFIALKNQGVKGCLLRIGSYKVDIDEKFIQNFTNAKEAGLLVGGYYFMHAKNIEEAKNDADKVVQILKNNNLKPDLPVFYDVENTSSDDYDYLTIGSTNLGQIIASFCKTIEDNGYNSGYYVNMNFASYLVSERYLLKYAFWGAKWGEEEIDKTQFPNLCLWQKSSSGSFEGIEGAVDIDISYVDFTKKK